MKKNVEREYDPYEDLAHQKQNRGSKRDFQLKSKKRDWERKFRDD